MENLEKKMEKLELAYQFLDKANTLLNAANVCFHDYTDTDKELLEIWLLTNTSKKQIELYAYINKLRNK
jgi:hypothetical protein